MSRLTELIAKAKAEDPQLGADLDREFKVLSSLVPFGLNFERHRPEAVELPQRPIRRGDKVRILPPRGSTKKGDPQLWRVNKIIKKGKQKLAELARLGAPDEQTTVKLDDLIVVAEFRDIIYPGLASTGKVSRGGEKPCHTVINGENYHVLKALTWTHRGKIDAIYIDPPYNTGAKDWKYNNDYVESDDHYRHSKWLAMMERRLLVAKELLNPEDSVLIVTIDEKEYLRLGLLLEQLFPEATVQMISTVINPSGASRTSSFRRTDEYIFFVSFGLAKPTELSLPVEWRIIRDKRAESLRWDGLLRSGSHTQREDRPNQFYPIYARKRDGIGIIEAIGDTYFGDSYQSESCPDGAVAIWPIRRNGSEGNWQVSPGYARKLLQKGYIKLGRWRASDTTVSYIKRGGRSKIESGVFPVVGRDKDNSVVVDTSSYESQFIPGTQWRIPSHSAEQGGTKLLRSLLGDRKFPFPKSLYAVEDALRFYLKEKMDAVVLDFFSGSGTTAHALFRLNKQDGGKRQCISVTNNEVGADEQKTLREKKLRPGDPDWEKLGICDYITKPRVEAAITGKTPDGEPIKGDYKFTDEFPMTDGFEENAEFFTLTYETTSGVNYQTAFKHIAPLLWLRAGSYNRRIEKLPKAGWEVADSYGLLVELDKATAFLKAVRKAEDLGIAYIVTDDERRFQALARRLPEEVEAIRLYESYLTNFAFANGETA